ncbi:hypothetical protein NKDENANG_04171 [Candidatus Entotheonellaceae bacterium PAL068K]
MREDADIHHTRHIRVVVGTVAVAIMSGKAVVSLRLPPLRTVRAIFTAHGSSQSVMLLRS